MTPPAFLHLDAAQVQQRLGTLDVLAAMRSLFRALGAGQATQPPQALTVFPGGKGDFITYSGVLAGEGVFGLKVSPYLATATPPADTAHTLLMSLETGPPLLLCDALVLTRERTAATTALAVDLLAPRQASRLAVIGSGPLALAHLRYVLPLRAWTQVRMASPNLAGKAGALRPLLAALPVAVDLAASLEQAVADAEVVLLCTASGTPELDLAALARPAQVTSISTNAPQAHEIAPGALTRMDVYCDHRATTPGTAGEMCLAQELGWSPASIRGDLGELLTGQASAPDYRRHVFFRSVGLGLEDVQMALAILRAGADPEAAPGNP